MSFSPALKVSKKDLNPILSFSTTLLFIPTALEIHTGSCPVKPLSHISIDLSGLQKHNVSSIKGQWTQFSDDDCSSQSGNSKIHCQFLLPQTFFIRCSFNLLNDLHLEQSYSFVSVTTDRINYLIESIMQDIKWTSTSDKTNKVLLAYFRFDSFSCCFTCELNISHLCILFA